MVLQFIKKLLVGVVCVVLLPGCAALSGKTTNAGTPGESAGESAASYVRSGDKNFNRGELNSALVQYMLALESDAQNADTFYKIGTIHRLNNDLDAAVESYNRATQLSPEHTSSREGLGLINLKKENYQMARVMFEGVLTADANRWQSMNGLGVLHDLQEEFPVAIKYYNDALELNPNSVILLNNIGYSYYLQRDWDQAENYFKRAVDLNSKFAQGWSNLALVYLQKGQVDDAKLAFNKTVSDHQALNNIAYFEYLRNNTVAAKGYFQEAIKVAPSYYSVAQQNMASLESGSGANDTRARIDPPISVSGGSSSSIELTTESNIGRSTAVVASTDDNPITTETEVLLVQQKLNSLGYDAGPADGVIGVKTKRAIRSYQRDKGITVNGNISKTLLTTF